MSNFGDLLSHLHTQVKSISEIRKCTKGFDMCFVICFPIFFKKEQFLENITIVFSGMHSEVTLTLL